MKRIITVLLALAMICSLFAGCLKKNYTYEEIKELIKKGNTVETVSFKYTYTENDVVLQTESTYVDGVNFKREISDESGKTTIVIGDDKVQTGFDSVMREGAKYPIQQKFAHIAVVPDEQVDSTNFVFVAVEKLLGRNAVKATVDGQGEDRTISIWVDIKTGLILKQQVEATDMNGSITLSELSFKAIPADTFTVPEDLNIVEDFTQGMEDFEIPEEEIQEGDVNNEEAPPAPEESPAA